LSFRVALQLYKLKNYRHVSAFQLPRYYKYSRASSHKRSIDTITAQLTYNMRWSCYFHILAHTFRCSTYVSMSVYRLYAGSNNIYRGGVFYHIKRIIPHPAYDFWSVDYDIALLKVTSNSISFLFSLSPSLRSLNDCASADNNNNIPEILFQIDGKIIFNDKVQPVRLPKKELASGVMVNVTGWGAMKVSARTRLIIWKQMGLNNSEFSRSTRRFRGSAIQYRKSNSIQYIRPKKIDISCVPFAMILNYVGAVSKVLYYSVLVKLLHLWTSFFWRLATFAYTPLIPQCWYLITDIDSAL